MPQRMMTTAHLSRHENTRQSVTANVTARTRHGTHVTTSKSLQYNTQIVHTYQGKYVTAYIPTTVAGPLYSAGVCYR